MKKVLFGITSLTIGGAERVLVDTVNALVDDFDVTVLMLYGHGDLEVKLDKRVHQITIEPKRFTELSSIEKKKYALIFSSQRLMKRLVKQQKLEDYDVVAAYLEGPMTLLLDHVQAKTRKLAWIHIDLFSHFSSKFRLKQHMKAYQSYDKLVFVSDQSLEHFKKQNKMDKPLSMIPNYIDASAVTSQVEPMKDIVFNPDVPNLVSVCRLVDKHKGLTRYARVMKRIKDEGINFHCYIVGGGPDLELIKQTITDLSLEDVFTLVGERKNPFPYMNAADYFTLFSHYEGAPIVFHEAKILGKKILVTSTSGDALLKDYPYAKIFNNDEEMMYQGIRSELMNPMIIQDHFKYENKDALRILIDQLFN